jgi:hypothetical protein
MFNYNGLFEPTKMSMIRGIRIEELDQELVNMIVEYIQQAIDLRLEN